MKDRQFSPFLKTFSFFHNSFMSILSLIMLVGILVGAYLNNRFSSWDAYCCSQPGNPPSVGLLPFSMYVFYLSKGFEFVDTFLLVLGKKQLIWLHKIHHLTTMSLVWHSMHVDLRSEITCGALNCFVHVIMYLYFACPIRILRSSITSLQLIQFVLALGVIGYTAYVRFTAEVPCNGTLLSEMHGIVMYGVYLGMFLNFFLKQYFGQRNQKKDGAPEEKKTLIIDGHEYDVTEFIKRHPGGGIIRYSLGTDATNAFEQFHLRSKKALKVLKSLPSTPVPVEKQPSPNARDYSKAFSIFSEKLRKEGLLDPSISHATYRVTELLVMHTLGYYLIFFTSYLPVGFVILGIAQGRCGWLMHEAGHYSLTGVIALDLPIQVILYGCGCGMSASFWRNQHNKHHATPQKLGYDPDLDTLPFVAFNRAVLQRLKSPFFRNVWIPLQAYIFTPIITSLVSIYWQFYLHPRHSLRTGTYYEFVAYFVRYLVWFYIFDYFGWTFLETLGAYMAYTGVGGAYIFTNFAVSHSHLPLVDDSKNLSWIEYAGKHSMNCTNTFFVNWWMGYLNFQIEHHLFPCVPQFRFPTISLRVKEFFAENGLHYDCRGYFEALAVTFQNLNTVGNAK